MRITSVIAALFAALLLAAPAEKANAGLFISITVAPPALPVYVQPPIPGPDYMWTPGYWAWDDDDGDYYWVPGAWVPAPAPGLLWTPGYWGWSNGVYAWNGGYWGPHIGFYGGVSYGFGYGGVGFEGGRWVGGSFSYNRSVTNISNTTVINNTYNKTVVVNNSTHVSFNGGNGGVQAQPNSQELAAAKEPHTAQTGDQTNHQNLAHKNPDLKASKNGGKPPIAAVSKPGDFSKNNIVAAKSSGGPFKPASLKTGTQTGNNSIKGNSNTNNNKNFNANLKSNSNNANPSSNKNVNTNLRSNSNNSNHNYGKNSNPPKATSLSKKPINTGRPPNRPVAKQPPPPKDKKKPG
jgi:WXXGXW repeat (2 copies)